MTEPMEHDTSPWSTRAKIAIAVFAIIGGFFLLSEHRAHVLPYLPWLLLLACPLMHMFMHHGHGGHGDGGHGHAPERREPRPASTTTDDAAPTRGNAHHRHGGPSA